MKKEANGTVYCIIPFIWESRKIENHRDREQISDWNEGRILITKRHKGAFSLIEICCIIIRNTQMYIFLSNLQNTRFLKVGDITQHHNACLASMKSWVWFFVLKNKKKIVNINICKVSVNKVKFINPKRKGHGFINFFQMPELVKYVFSDAYNIIKLSKSLCKI